MIRSIIAALGMLATSSAVQAMTVCTTADATRVINQLQNQNSDEAAAIPQENGGAAAFTPNPMRQATIQSMARAYCFETTGNDPVADNQDKIEFDCTMLSGMYSDKRVYWTSCPNHTLTFNVKSISSYSLSVIFYSDTRPVEWPGSNTEYTLLNHEVHTYSLNCKSGEKICYGAWYTGHNVDTSWGVGPNRSISCTNCCYTCGATTEVIQLGFVPGE